MSDIVYKIRRKSDGLYSMGGSTPRFTKTGKIWKQKGHLTNHINQLDREGKRRYQDCEIIPLQMVETVAGDILSIQEYIDNRQAAIDERDRQWRERKEKEAKEQRHRDYLKLKAEFGDE